MYGWGWGGRETEREFSVLFVLTHTHHNKIPPGDGHTDYRLGYYKHTPAHMFYVSLLLYTMRCDKSRWAGLADI